MRNLNGNKGFELFDANGKKIIFLLRDSAKVSDVTTYTYMDYPNGVNPYNYNSRWSNNPYYNERKFYDPYKNLIAFSWQNIFLRSKESRILSFLVGAEGYPIPHTLSLVTNLQELYDSFEEVTLRLKSESVYPSKTVTVTRTMNMSHPSDMKKTVMTFTDSGTTEFIEDTLDAPGIDGIYAITYTIESEGISSKYNVNIIYSERPVFTLLDDLPDKYLSNSQVNFGVEASGDDPSDFYVQDSQTTYFSKQIYNTDTGNVVFNVSFDLQSIEVGTIMNLSIFMVNQFNVKSEVVPFVFEIVDNLPPEIEVFNSISTYYRKGSYIYLEGRYRDIDGSAKACVYSSFNYSNGVPRFCENLTDGKWNKFDFIIPLTNMSQSINVLSIFCIDQLGYPSIALNQSFGIYSPSLCIGMTALKRIHYDINALLSILLTLFFTTK